MVWGQVAATVAPIAIQGLSSLMGGSSGGIDYNKIQSLISGSTDTQNRMGADYTSNAASLRQQLLDAMGQSKTASSTGLNTASSNYLGELNPLTSASVAESNKALLRSTLGAVPQAQQQAREALAATTGLGSGYAADTARKISEQGLQGYQTGRTTLEQQARDATIQGLGTVYTKQADQIAQQLGIDEQTHMAIMNSGNEALKTAYTEALQSERDKLQGSVSAEIGMGNQSMAEDTANRNAWMSAIGSSANIASNLYAQDSAKKYLSSLFANSGPAVK